MTMNKGEYRFDAETITRFDEWEARWLKDTGLSFTHDLWWSEM